LESDGNSIQIKKLLAMAIKTDLYFILAHRQVLDTMYLMRMEVKSKMQINGN